MSDYVPRPHFDEEATSGTSSGARQLRWMSHWMKNSSKPLSTVDNSSLISYRNNGHADRNCYSDQGKLTMVDGLTNSERGDSKRMSRASLQNRCSSSPFPTLGNKEYSSSSRTQSGHEFGHKNTSLALVIGRENSMKDLDSIHENNLSSARVLLSNPSPGAFNKTTSAFSSNPLDQNKHSEASSPVVVFEKHFSNDNITCLGQGHCKYQKFSTYMVHEKKMNNGLSMLDDPSMSKNFLPFFLRKQSESESSHRNLADFDGGKRKLSHGCQSMDKMPCSVRNVETMRICTMVDSVENSPGGPPKISQRAHHFLFTKETCLNVSERCQVIREQASSAQCKKKNFGESLNLFTGIGSSRPQGVTIQPLGSSSEEQENSGKVLTSEGHSKNKSSAEADTMQIDAPKHNCIPSGIESSPLSKVDAVDENIPAAAFSSGTEKRSSKKPIFELPDINEEVSELQPAGSSTDSKEPSTSRVHSLDAKELFPLGEQTSRPEFTAHQDPPVGTVSGNSRWIKRLKLSSADSFGVGTKSSEMEEASSREKFNKFFNRIMKSNRSSLDLNLSNHHEKEQIALDQNMESRPNSGSHSRGSEKRSRSVVLGCSWIQRLRKHSTAPTLRNPEPLVICEPHSLKLGQYELGKKQFPSIDAMALMGKAMNGFRPCEFRKRGPVVVWNTKEF